MPALSSTTVTRLSVCDRTLAGLTALPPWTPPVNCWKVNAVLNSAGALSEATGNMNLRTSMLPKSVAPSAASPPMIIRNWRRVVSARTRILPRADSYGFSTIQSSGRGSFGRQCKDSGARGRLVRRRGDAHSAFGLQEWIARGRRQDVGEDDG